MSDVFTRQKRSEVMSHIRGTNNKGTELLLIRILRRAGISGWRRNQSIFGKPDFLFRKDKVALFVDGCFWHSCRKHSNIPTNNRAFWTKKLEANKARDRRVTRVLKRDGWKVVRIWEHDLRHPLKVVAKLTRHLSA
jgi:DNA mismatch endonuclease (patch repair protein)